MKYMTFNRSCAYAGVANLLEKYGLHYEDYEIVKELSIPYLFYYNQEESRYLAGPMLQGAPWFNYFLNSLGLDLIEEILKPEDVLANLDKNNQPSMCSLNLNPNHHLNHAVLFEGKEDEGYRFLNMKRENSTEPDYYLFKREELIEKLSSNSRMCYLVPIETVISFDLSEDLKLSLQNLNHYEDLLNEFCSKEQEVTALIASRDCLFAPLMLDVLSMMEIIGEKELVQAITTIRTNYMKLMKENRPLLLTKELPMEDLNRIIEKYKSIIQNYYDNYIE